jgi:hypothetical protein
MALEAAAVDSAGVLGQTVVLDGLTEDLAEAHVGLGRHRSGRRVGFSILGSDLAVRKILVGPS